MGTTTSQAAAKLTADILSNTITTPPTGQSGVAISADEEGSATADFKFDGNTINVIGKSFGGIEVGTPDGAAAILSVIVTNNTLTMSGSNSTGITIFDGVPGGSSVVDIENNEVDWAASATQAGYAINLASKGGPTMQVEQGSQTMLGAASVSQVQSLVAANNPNAHAPKPAQAFYPQYATAVYIPGVDPGESSYAGHYTIVTNTHAIVPPAPPTLATPTISGTLQEGVTLSATVAGSTGGGATTLQWQENFNGTNFVAINGATGSTYTLTEADIGAQLRVVATTVASNGFRTVAISDDTGRVTDNLTLTQPAITGTDQVGQVLTATTPTVDNADATITYQWDRNGTAIPGADGQTYRLAAADLGDTITVVATATDPHFGNIAETSAATSTVTAFTAQSLPTISIGTLGAGQEVTISFEAMVNAQTDQLIVNPHNIGTITSSLPTIHTNTVVTTLDTLTLGNQIFDDVNGDGKFDAGDTGVANVNLTLFADTNNDGVFDAGDTQIAITTTNGSGIYSFAGLAAGNYIVEVDANNFAAGGALVNLASSDGIRDTTPSDNIDNDSNGLAAAGGIVATNPIALSYRTPANGGDTNNTLDLGFVSGTVGYWRRRHRPILPEQRRHPGRQRPGR